jgi:uncharacterized circularly permuted ATP-grasp superfamily protein/uncharacterized alpha-E superfamily protein
MVNRDEANELSQLRRLLPHYRSEHHAYDELLAADTGHLKSWLRLLAGGEDHEQMRPVATLTPEDVCRKWERVKKRLLEYTEAAGESDKRRNAEVDPIPVIMPEEQWSHLAKGIAQRAHLLDLILRDLYGPQELLLRGVIPPELVYGHQGYLGAMRGSIVESQPMLTLYAAQLCRDVHGQWHVLADRTQGPSGAGYSVENRIAISGVLPHEFRDMLVQRSAPFFAALRDSMNRHAIPCDELALMVLLSPGVHSSAYFEDAYLARYLGYTLAQSQDLTVRGGRVFLKTLAGLKRVSNILRRVPDLECDPLELVPSAIGVPGLCQAARDRQVTVANHLGCGWAEQPALMAVLPKLCRVLLDEELLLPSWPTWWCGDKDSYQFVEHHASGLVLRDAFAKKIDASRTMESFSHAEQARMLEKLRRQPWRWIATKPPNYSTTPCWHRHQVVAWPMVLRVFATHVQGKYEVLPSGIGRVGAIPDQLNETLVSGQMSKDLWILGQRPVPMSSLRRPPTSSLEVRRTSFDLPSRVAEELHWLGRWTARAEGLVRHARYCARRLSEERDTDNLPIVQEVIEALDVTIPNVLKEASEGNLYEQLQQALVDFCFNQSQVHALGNALIGSRRNATYIRDRLSRDSWQIISRLETNEAATQVEPAFGDVAPLLNHLLNQLTAFAGLVAESMTRGPGWLFLDIGRRLERIQQQIHLIEKLLIGGQGRTVPVLEAMLDIMDSSITYRYRYLMNIEIGPVLDLLLLDQANPRSMVFQFMKLEEHLLALTSLDREGLTEQRARIQSCLSLLQLAEIADLTAVNPAQVTTAAVAPVNEYGLELMRLMTEFTTVIEGLAEYITNRFFAHTKATHQLGENTR